MELTHLRKRIDKIDEQLIKSFEERMETAKEIAEYKRQNHLAIFDPERERNKISEILENVSAEMQSYTQILYSLLFELSRSYQEKLLLNDTSISKALEEALESTPKIFPHGGRIACQGVEGAYSQRACERLFQAPSILYFHSFENVFSAVQNGLCSYGILPIENSTAGSVNQVYDLMSKYNFYIVRSLRVKIDHCVLAKKGVQLGEIKEIISHEQAINQCGEFLRSMGDVKITYCANTAVAAEMVANSERNDIAAISSRSCCELYGLSCLESSVQDRENNYTRFICISKKMEIFPGSDRTSIMMVLPHKPGALYKVLSRFYALGINLLKLESRPIPQRDFEFKFYFDLETSVYSQEFIQLMSELETYSEEFCYLGSYLEVI